MPTPVRVPVSRSVRALVVLLGLGWSGRGWACFPYDMNCCIEQKEDIDGDGWFPKGAWGTTSTSCGFGYKTSQGEDCNDDDSRYQESEDWYKDADRDGYYGSQTSSCGPPNKDYYALASLTGGNDCNDEDAAVYPDPSVVEEVPGNAVDEDCDGYLACYEDLDGDTIGSTTLKEVALDGTNKTCEKYSNSSSNNNDCNDSDSDGDGDGIIDGFLSSPKYKEVKGNEVDEDCDDTCSCYEDVDRDGYGVVSRFMGGPPASDGKCSASCADKTSNWASEAGDCDDDPSKSACGAACNPGITYETCEPGSVQFDNDCNDSVHTHGDPPKYYEEGDVDSSFVLYYDDKDGDGYGDDSTAPRYQCGADADSTYDVTVGGDCNDSKEDLNRDGVKDGSLINAAAMEQCNEIDDDCDGFEDEPTPSEGAGDERTWVGPTDCTEYWLDFDQDGQGADTRLPGREFPPSYNTICLCDGDVEEKSDSQGFRSSIDFCPDENPDCNLTTFRSLRSTFEVNESRKVTHLARTYSDCDDGDPDIYETSSRPEVQDGFDNNCTGSVALMELDCDGDGHIAGDIGSYIVELSELGLPGTTCDGLDDDWPYDPLLCAGDIIVSPICGEAVVKDGRVTSSLEYIWRASTDSELFELNDNSKRTKRSTAVTEGADCDDINSYRNPSAAEVCDGFDSDCGDSSACSVLEAVIGECVGEICEEESDADCDGYITCTLDEPINDGECFTVSELSGACDTVSDQLGSGDTRGYCSRSFPLVGQDEVLVCDGILPPDRDDVHPNERDEDSDAHLACGPTWPESPADVGDESVFLLAYFVEDDPRTPVKNEAEAIPLLLPRAILEGDPENTTRRVVPADFVLRDELEAKLDPHIAALGFDRDLALAPVINGRTFNEMSESLYEDFDPLFDLCVRAELCATLKWNDRPQWCESATWYGELATRYGRCAVIELELNADGFRKDVGDVPALDSVDLGTSWAELSTTDTNQAVAGDLGVRLVWSAERILESRRRVVEWDCFITFGTYGCEGLLPIPLEPDMDSPLEDALRAFLPSIGGGDRRRDFATEQDLYRLENDDRWWQEIGRFRSSESSEEAEVLSRYDGNLLSCWGDPTVEPDLGISVSPRVGGDCSDGEGTAHRDALEGPYDLRSSFIDEIASCDTCVDGLDNNCDGLTDCEDPGCAPCFVGQGSGCAGAAEDSPCASSGGCSAGRGARAPGLAALGALLLSAITLTFRRKEAR